MKKLIYLFLTLFCTRILAYDYDVSICCIFQNEARFLEEWIDYHRSIGIDHFYLFDNASTDNPLSILEKYIEEKIVDYIYVPILSTNHFEWNDLQCKTYMNCINDCKNKTKWLCVIDSDEFIVLLNDRNIKNFLKEYEDYAGICISWVFFGTSGIWEIPYKELIKTLVYRASLNFPDNKISKSIIKPICISNCTNPHFFEFKVPYFAVTPNKNICPAWHTEPCFDKIRLHHYWCRDKKFLFEQKIPRREIWFGKDNFIIEFENLMNAEYDNLINEIIFEKQQ